MIHEANPKIMMKGGVVFWHVMTYTHIIAGHMYHMHASKILTTDG